MTRERYIALSKLIGINACTWGGVVARLFGSGISREEALEWCQMNQDFEI